MKMLVAVAGKVCLPVKFNPARVAVNFTIQAGPDRYMVETVGFDQYKLMKGVYQIEATHLVVVGTAYTFKGRCGQHHVGIKPVFIVPIDHQENLELLQAAAGQWFSSNLSNLAKMREG